MTHYITFNPKSNHPVYQKIFPTMAPSCRNCKRVKYEFDIREKFIDACANNELEKVIACCGSLGLEVNTVSEDGESGLRTAVNNNSEDVVAWLLAQPEIEVNIV